ncbi:sperm-associated antigen 17 isoform X2 [Mastacembelus armatus]|uniref:sperm-associated antigen 17 isoform X2 n=1 Tax=Mastacembelus armatus TaxID=205130 RepID=UPI000E4620E7|nr:sperm-associated antigen 17 isoform X2 [Mastacembelus armatus]
MPPKAAQKGSAKSSSAAGVVNKSWESGLTKAPFEEDSWQACVNFLVGESPEDEKLIQTLVLVEQHYRLFTLLTFDSTIAKIHELGNLKAKKLDNVPIFCEVTEPAKVLLDAGEEIPCDLMAKVLKFLLLQIKTTDQQRRVAEQIKEAQAKTAPPSATKDKAGAKVSEKKTKSPLPPVGPSKEKTTNLKRRDDVEPPKYLDDEPDDGPQHYILVLGFYQPQLIGVLDAIGVHVANVIKICSKHTHRSEVQQEEHAPEGNEQTQTASPVVDAASVELAAQTRRLDLFWSGLSPVLDNARFDSKLHNVAQLSYTVPDLLLSFQTLIPEAALKLGSQIFKDVANLIYDCLDWRRQHQHYLESMKLIDVAAAVGPHTQPLEVLPTSLPMTPLSKKKSVQEESPPAQKVDLHPVTTHVDMRYYSSLLDLVPPEASSVPLILHCMLEQVVISTEQPVSAQSLVAEKPKPDDGPWLDHQLVSYMLQSFLPLVHTAEERSLMLNGLLTTVWSEEDKKKLMATFGTEEPQSPEYPHIIRHNDERTLRLKNVRAVQGFDPEEVELSMMRLSPVWDLIQSVKQQRNSSSCWMAVKQQLQHYCTDDDVSWPVVERLFHQSVFEAMPLTRLDKDGGLLKTAGPLGTLEPAEQHPPTIIPWDNPLSYAKQQLHNLQTKGPTFLTEDPGNTEPSSGTVCSHLDVSDIQGCRLRSLFGWHYAELHDASVFPQVLQSASDEYRCLDTFRGSHNNILYIFCHNPMSPQRQCKEFWDAALHTDVRFRVYLEHVADTISDWTREEELKKEEKQQLSNRSLAESPEDENAKRATEEEKTLEPVIRKDSLKAWKMEQERLKEEEMTKKSKKENTPKVKQPEEDKKSRTMSGGKKSRAETAASSAKTAVESDPTTAPPMEENEEMHQTEEPFTGFIGYRMDGKLIHVSGRLQCLFPSDGGLITVENVSYVKGSNLMKVAVNKDGHHFYTHINQVVDCARAPPQPHDKDTSDKKDDCKVSEPVEMKRVKHGSFSAVLRNGVHLSYSFYGSTGQCIVSPHEVGGGIPETSSTLPIPLSAPTHNSKGTELNTSPLNKDTPASQIQPPESQSKVCEGQSALPSNLFTSLNLSVPNGLLLQFLREDTPGVCSEEQGMLVRQSFPLHGSGERRQLQDPSLSKEMSRIVTSQGTVIRYMRDGSAEVLFADGTVSFSQDCGPVWVPDSEVDVTPQKAEDNTNEQSFEKQANAQRGCWSTTTPSGARICTVGTTHERIPTSPLLTFKATDPITHQVMLSREDLVVSVQNPDGSVSVEHADGTRITSLCQDRPPDTTHHMLRQTGEQPESVCVTRCVDSVNEKMHIQDTCDAEEQIGGDSAVNACDKEEAGHFRELSECESLCHDSMVCKNGEESLPDNGARTSCGSDKDSVSKERVVMVEKEGCATVVMYPERHTAHVFLADRTVITGNNRGAFQVLPSSVGILQIQSDGKCVYSSDSLVTPSPKGSAPTNPPGSYTMSHTDSVACDVTDPDGNHFQVRADGQVSVLNFSPAPSTLTHEEEEQDGDMAGLHVQHREHCPRLFLVHADGSGTELLSSQTVEELLYQAHCDPTIALLKEPLPDTQDEFGITILKPSEESVWSKWVLEKQSPDITPPNLRNRSWHDFPRAEKIPGPPFGTDLGRGLTITERSCGSAVQHPPVRSCPKVLEMRELFQHRAVTARLRNTVDKRLKEYIEILMEREQQSEETKVKDPRTEEEIAHASHLLSRVLSFAEKEDDGSNFGKRTSVDIASLYSQGTTGAGASAEQSDVSEDTATTTSDSFTSGKESKWTKRLAQYRQDLCDDKACWEALRKKNIVPYFHPENVPIYQSLLQQQTPAMMSLSKHLAPIARSDGAEAFLKDAPQETTPRPLNPTPSKSASRAAGSDRMPEKRPTNPTPQTAAESIRRGGTSGPCKSLQLDVTGQPRRTKVRLPASILRSKPCSVPNQQFLSVEEPVRRKCRTVSLTGLSVVARGFQLLPSRADFGTLREGTSTAITVLMVNVGVDTCRFHVKQPPPATGLQVIYNPGPVAAGLQVQLQVQLFATCAAQSGDEEPRKHVSHDIIIHTETDILYLPVTATILPGRLFDIWLREHSGKKSPHRPRFVRSSAAANTGHPDGGGSSSSSAP